jgi:SNF2 family DNA or RNA helicase
MEHQERSFYRARDREFYGHLWDMRTGKTAVIIHQAAYLKAKGKIDAVLVVSPNYLKSVWADQFEEHAPGWLEYEARVWQASAKMEREVNGWEPDDRLSVLLMNEEAFSTKRGVDVAEKFLKRHKVLMIVDESTSIKSPTAKRTKNVLKLRTLAAYRRILTGTPTTTGPLDLWAQFYYLDPGILGFSNYYGFRNRYAMMGGFKGKEVKGYIDLDIIQARIDRHSDRYLRTDVRDMPPKLYQRATVDLTSEQQRLYDTVREEMLAEWEHAPNEQRRLEVRSILAQMLRLQQIVGGFLPSEKGDEDDSGAYSRRTPYRSPEPIPGGNPKLDALLGYIGMSEPGTKIVTFSRFRAEIAAIVARIEDAYDPESVVQFHGGVKPAEKEVNKRAFVDPESPVRFFVANQRSARMGLDLSVSSLVLYFSNSFDYLDRVQSEDRTETILSESESTMYVDLMASVPIDETIRRSLLDKRKLSEMVTGDEPLSSWI